MKKPLLSIDFDDTIYDPKTQQEVVGAGYSLRMLAKKYDLIVLTAREGENLKWAKKWIREELGLNIPVTNVKTRSLAYIDDKGFKFRGWIDVLNNF